MSLTSSRQSRLGAPGRLEFLRRPSGDQDGTAGGKKAGGETVPDSFTPFGNENVCRAHFKTGRHYKQRISEMLSPRFHSRQLCLNSRFIRVARTNSESFSAFLYLSSAGSPNHDLSAY
jgi:hypothetical protein